MSVENGMNRTSEDSHVDRDRECGLHDELGDAFDEQQHRLGPDPDRHAPAKAFRPDPNT